MIRQPKSTAWLPEFSQFDGAEKRKILSLCEAAAPNPYSNVTLYKSKVIESLMVSAQPPNIRFAALSYLLSKLSGQWPVLELVRCHAQLWKGLPEEAKAGHRSYQPLVDSVETKLKHSYSSILDLLHQGSLPALKDAGGRAVSHRNLYKYIEDFHLPISTAVEAGTVVAIGLSNGPTLALAVLAVSTYYTALPVNASSGAEQFRADVLQGGAKVVLVAQADVDRLKLRDKWVRDEHIQVVLVESKPDLTLRMRLSEGAEVVPRTNSANGPDDTAILLFTSGTSGTKKLVPLTVHSIVASAAFIIESWDISSSDICLNQMPLNHIGGILRNLFAPILAESSTICCTAFDANLFWDIVEEQHPTWYYASPTMHATILETSHHRQDAVDKCRMRLVCNAAGGLLPSLAVQLRDTFRCTVLPSYGMTECMPISTPPIGYTLDRPGTSGMSAGPEIAVLDSGGGRIVAPQAVGRIAIRGAPVFSGYLRDGEMDRSPFTEDGWFDTGDLGYLDSDGFLFITGRSKEVINRGGELISPFEVEDAIVSAAKDLDSPLYGRVSQALAFSVPHNVLQEVVGVVLVTPRGAQRTDLRQLHQALKSSLQQAKWPILIVYMEDVPKNNNKVLRIQLHKRLNLPELNDDIPLSERHFEASCPPPNTALSIQIECSQYLVDYHWLTQMLEVWAAGQYSVLVRRDVHGFPEVIAAPDLAGHGLERTKIISDLEHRVWEYFDALYHPSRCLVLDEPFRLTREGYIDEEEVNSRLAFSQDSQLTSADGVEDRVAQKFAEVLGCSCDQLSSETDFFDAGGDSLKAGKLLALLRHEFSMRLPIDVLFSTSRLGSLSGIISKEVDSGPSVSLHDSKHDNSDSNYHRDTRSSTHILLLIIHLIPLLILYPMRRAFTWTVFAVSLSKTEMLPTANSTPGRFLNLIGSMALGKVATRFIAPFVAILLKWLVIGRYRDGLYPMWGPYHTRWWFVQKAIAVCGMGHFNMCNTTRVWYYRLLGARIGKNVSIEKGAILGEYDLIDIGDNSALDRCICRPFAAEQNTTMYLGRITIGDHCTIGLKSIVAPGSVLVDGTYIGPNSSSWESGDVTEAEHSVSPSKVASPHVLLSGLVLWPLFSFARFVRAIPWMASIYPLVSFPPIVHQNLLASILSWFSAPHRIGIHYAALIADVTLGPIFYFGVVVLLRWLMDLMFGPVVPAPAHSQSNFTKLRMELMRKLMPGDAFHEFVGLFGTHYEMTSIAVRAMAGKVGKRVYWPGTGPSVTDYGLLDIGDDVVFGSRAALVTSDASGSDYVRIGDGAMVSDRVVVLPGTTLGERTIMGSGALTRRNKSYPAHSTWIGSRDGEAINLNDGKVSYDNLEASRPLQERRRNAFYLKTPRLSSVAQWSQSVIEDALSPNRISFVLPTPSPTVSAQASPTTSTWSGSDASDDTLISHTSGDISTGYCMDLEAKRKCSMSTLRSVYSDSTLADRDEVRPDSTSSSPFGRAFYQGKAPYYVLGHIPIFVISTFAIIFVAIFWRVPTVSAVQITAQVLERSPEAVLKYVSYPPILYLLFFGLIAVIMALEVPLALAIVVGSKWLLMGRRQAGNYDWDKSSYCQRWQLFLTIERLRRSCYGGHGILGMLTGTHYAVLYFRALGATIGKDCALFAGGLPSLMFTEPDLLTLGDRVSVDDASLVCHINSRGCFNLNLLNVGDRSVLRSGSRLLSGASMGKDACLLEHTLVMAGDIVDDGVTMQRWPAEEFKGKRLPTISDTCSA